MYGLYIHIPFCIKKCHYCDFTSFPNCERFFNKYIEALLNEMNEYRGYLIDSVFIGGGTPTILSAKQLEKLLSYVNETFDIKTAEFSIEANPKTLDEEKLSVLKSSGVNRISIGVQSFVDEELVTLGRVHSAEDAKKTIALSKKYIDNLNIDLMFSIPGQTLENVKKTLDTAVALNPTHLSCYSLILEEGTGFFEEYEKGNLILTDDDTDRDIFEFICNFLKKNGYNRYEISNFSKSGLMCRHNLKYWDMDEYIGIGVSAHSYTNKKRFFNTNSLQNYIEGNYDRKITFLSDDDLMSEFMITGLRKISGINTEKFKKLFGKLPQEVYNIEKFINSGLMEYEKKMLRLTSRGLDISNSILCEFV